MRLHTILLVTLAWGASFGILRSEDRSIDGSGNNLIHTDWGAVDTQLRRIAPADYSDGISALTGTGRPSPREISNQVSNQTESLLNHRQLANYVWQWGQFLDHDIDLTPGGGEAEDVPVPSGDVHFDPMGTGTATLPFRRSQFDPATGTSTDNPRQQNNIITSYIDASNVYGSDAIRTDALRSYNGGRLLTGPGDLLPKNTFGLPNVNAGPFDDADLFLAGDVRANEQVGLTAMHTLFLREHNRLADEIATANSGWTDELIYQRARKHVGAQLQVITYQEFLPALLGPLAPGVQSTYDSSINASITNEFSTALYRLGHSMIGGELHRIQDDGSAAPGGHLALKDAFFNPNRLSSSEELDYILKGFSVYTMQEIDTKVVDDLRHFLFAPGTGLDLVSLNIQRGRDHGLPDYNSARTAFGMSAVTSFAEITSDVDLQNDLAALYGNVDDIDLWVGALAEDHLLGASVGELLAESILDQFTNLRDGDRFWYRNDLAFSANDIAELEATSLADIIMRNTAVTTMHEKVMFAVPEPGTFLQLIFGVPLLLWALRFMPRRLLS